MTNSEKAMEDELIRNSGQIYRKLRSEGSFFQKLRSITGEILVIGFAVSFSIWINNYAEYQKEQEEVLDFLVSCKVELSGDTSDLKRCRREIQFAIETNNLLIGISPKTIDSIQKNNLDLSYNGRPMVRKTHMAGYEGYKSSGRLGDIENRALKRKILEYYEVQMPSLLQVEEYYNDHTTKTIELIFDRYSQAEEEAFLEKKVQIQIMLNTSIAADLSQSYENMEKQVSELQMELSKKISAKQSEGWF